MQASALTLRPRRLPREQNRPSVDHGHRPRSIAPLATTEPSRTPNGRSSEHTESDRLGTVTDLALARRRRSDSFADDPWSRKTTLRRVSPLGRTQVEPAPASRVQDGAQAISKRSRDGLTQSVRRLPRSADRHRGPSLGSAALEHTRFWSVRPPTSLARIEDGDSRSGLADESVHTDQVDARLRGRTLRRLFGRARSRGNARLVLTGSVRCW